MSSLFSNHLTADQQTVLARLAAGDTIQAAAIAAGVHRNTILHWRRTSPAFQADWHSLQDERAFHWREQALPLAPLAINAIRDILEDPKTSPSVRLRAALAIHKIVSTPPPSAVGIRPGASSQPSVGDHTGNLVAFLQRLQQSQDESEARTTEEALSSLEPVAE